MSPKLTKFDIELYVALVSLEYATPAVTYVDENTNVTFIPIQYLYFVLPRKYWRMDIETRVLESITKLKSLGLAESKDIAGESVWRSTTPVEIAKGKLHRRKIC